MQSKYEWVFKEKGILKYYRDPALTRAGILLIRNSYAVKDQSYIYISVVDVPNVAETLLLHACVKRYMTQKWLNAMRR